MAKSDLGRNMSQTIIVAADEEIGYPKCGQLAVLVSSAMPRDTREPFLREGDVWVARFEAAWPLAEALRATLLEMHKLRVAQQVRTSPNQQRPECSPQFAQRVRSMVESVELMKRDLDAEKAAMMRIWAKREKQLQRMETGMLNVVGDLQGIGQGAVGQLESIAALPTPEGNETELQGGVI